MLFKLLKLEFKNNRNTFLALYLVIIALTFIVCFGVNNNSSSNDSLNFFMGIAVILYVVAVFGVFIYLLVAIINSFRKSLFSREGYLTLTLPVSTNTLIFSKYIMALIWGVITTIVVSVSTLFVVSDIQVSINQIIDIMKYIGIDSTVFIYLIYLFVSAIQFISIVFLVVSFVNTKFIKRNRGLIGVGLYIVINIILNFISTMLTNSVSTLSLNQNVTSIQQARAVVDSYNSYLISALAPSIIFAVIIIVACFFGIKYCIEKKIELD